MHFTMQARLQVVEVTDFSTGLQHHRQRTTALLSESHREADNGLRYQGYWLALAAEVVDEADFVPRSSPGILTIPLTPN